MGNDTVAADPSSAAPLDNSVRPSLTHAELERLVRYWVGMLKESGLRPEEVLVAVKSLVRETIVPRYDGYADGKNDGDASRMFVRDASRWCIDAYFERAPNE